MTASIERDDVLTTSGIEAIAKTPDSELRAHRIALAYRIYADALDRIINPGEMSVGEQMENCTTPKRVNANWFNFASWGTLTVTQNISGLRPPQRLNVGIGAAVRRYLTPAVLRARASDGQAVGRALAWGQRLIFVSACVGQLRFAEIAKDPASLDRFAAGESELFTDDDLEVVRRLSKWDDQVLVSFARHIRSVQRAYQLFACASLEESDKVKSKFVLGGSVILTAVEQDLVQAAIAVVLNVIPYQVEQYAEWTVARATERVIDLPAEVSMLALPQRVRPYAQVAQTAWSRFMTDQVLVMALPTETLRLGRDIPPRVPGRAYYPAGLIDLLERVEDAIPAGRPYTESHRRRMLRYSGEYVGSLNRTFGSGRGSAARDWRRWDERMNWAVTLMRSRQKDRTLFWWPYTEDDQRRILLGRPPLHSGDPSSLEVEAPLEGSIFFQAEARY